ncbi:MAG TPA: hypothetical protein VFZ17_09925 [Acidimicrobiia bacterium]|nr:hypothetical protein [Acidimicrobiia bacterium]
MLIMILVVVALVAFATAMVWYFVARGSKAATISEQDFDDTYRELVANGELVDRGTDRDAAWRDFHAWQLKNEQERLSWEEGITE